jgi:predicted secreted hydrolase
MRAAAGGRGIVARSNRGLRESTLVVFDRTFAITGVLRLLALIVAFVGVTGALMALQLERAREIGVLRTTGLTPAQVWSLVTTQTGLMGLVAALLALPLGYAMAWAMVHVINRRSFGWSFDMVVGATPFAQALFVGLAPPCWPASTRRGACRASGRRWPCAPNDAPHALHPTAAGTLLLAVAACSDAGRDAPVQATLRVGELLGGADTMHERAVAPRAFSFPADHGPHPTFRTEWWYYTGNLTADDGREFGYQLTFFRSALTDSAPTWLAEHGGDAPSAWRSRHAYMAHFAVSDIASARIHAAQRFARDALGLAGARAEPFAVWTDAWRADGTGTDDAKFPVRLVASGDDVAIDLLLERGKPPVLQGGAASARRGQNPATRPTTTRTCACPAPAPCASRGRDVPRHRRELARPRVEHQRAQRRPRGLGLDGAPAHRRHRTHAVPAAPSDGTAGPFSAGSFVPADGAVQQLGAHDFTMTPRRHWQSPLDGTAYPVGWRVEVPGAGLDLRVEAAFDAQELNLAVRYWEGAVRVTGTRGGRAVGGRGYLEMTGWAADRPGVAEAGVPVR